jgi:hypothetical protein
MADDPPSTGTPGAPGASAPVPAAAAVTPPQAPEPRIDLNSRIERRMWLLHKGSDRAEARSGIKFGRREFRVYVNGGLLWSRNYALDETTQFDADAAARLAEFVALGWVPPGDAPKAD